MMLGCDWLGPVIACLAAMSLASCAMGPPKLSPEETLAKMEQFTAQGGYETGSRYDSRAIRDKWKHGSTTLDVSLLLPERAGRFPLVVYLPGLGEDAESGILWREAWAKAGYAVFSLQPVSTADALQALGAHRQIDARAIGRVQFSQNALKVRLDHLAWALEELKRRASSPQAPYALTDPTQLAIAGYDLGAQTAQAAAGEATKAPGPDLKSFGFRAAIVLSPVVDLAAGGLATRFAGMTLPLLMVTGSEDQDPSGVTSPSLRLSLWRSLPKGEKYLLLLQDAGHRLLSGARPGSGALPPNRPEEPTGDEGEVTTPEDGGEDGMPPGAGGRARRGSMAGMGGGGLPGGFMGMGRRRQGEAEVGHHLAAVAGVTTAFLDAEMKADPRARRWLLQSAARWLGRHGSMKSK